jgi:hypothetical protein
MDHPCHKCGLIVEDGTPFCAHCGAPQIRVAIAEALAAADPAVDQSAQVHASPAVESASPELDVPARWPQALRPCSLAALLAILLVGLGLYPVVAVLGAGFLAVVFYRQRNPVGMVRTAAGARLGALSGLLFSAMAAILLMVLVVLFHEGPKMRNAMLQAMQQTAARSSDPQAQIVLDYFKSPGGCVVMMLLGAVFAFFAAIILASIGGALGGALLSRRDRNSRSA